MKFDRRHSAISKVSIFDRGARSSEDEKMNHVGFCVSRHLPFGGAHIIYRRICM